MAEKLTKPNLAFLRKVAAGEVMAVRGYSRKRGGYDKFYGGEATAKAQRHAGFVKPWGAAELGRPAIVELTEAGRAALQSSEAQPIGAAATRGSTGTPDEH